MEKIKWYNLNCFIYTSQTINQKTQKEVAKKKALENLFKSMLNNLMGGKLRVGIVNGVENEEVHRIES